MMAELRLGLALAIPLLFAACSTPGKPVRAAFASSGRFTELNILTTPVGLDLDGRPGLDGFSVKVYANIAENPKPVPIRSGTLEIVMFDGTLFGRTNLPPPLHVWSFSSDQLREYEFKARIGTGYDLLLRWGSSVPTRRLITVGARYTAPDGQILTSGLSSVTVLDR
jgi:hypothetical protein